MLKKSLLICLLVHAIAGVAAAFVGWLAPRAPVVDIPPTRMIFEYGSTLALSLLLGALCPLGFSILLNRIRRSVMRSPLQICLLFVALCLLFAISALFQSFHFPPLSLYERRSSTDVVYWALYPIYMGAAGGIAALVALVFRRNPD